jgi:hypothetical protein
MARQSSSASIHRGPVPTGRRGSGRHDGVPAYHAHGGSGFGTPGTSTVDSTHSERKDYRRAGVDSCPRREQPTGRVIADKSRAFCGRGVPFFERRGVRRRGTQLVDLWAASDARKKLCSKKLDGISQRCVHFTLAWWPRVIGISMCWPRLPATWMCCVKTVVAFPSSSRRSKRVAESWQTCVACGSHGATPTTIYGTAWSALVLCFDGSSTRPAVNGDALEFSTIPRGSCDRDSG